jgi:hypothetical protein
VSHSKKEGELGEPGEPKVMMHEGLNRPNKPYAVKQIISKE